MKDMLIDAKKNKYAIAQFNLNSLLWTRPILEAAEEKESPVIVATSDRLVDYLGGFKIIYRTVSSFVKELNISVPVALHLDHGLSVSRCKEAIDAGFSSVMIDGSKYNIDKNISMTKEVVNYASNYNVSVEAEVGTVGGSEDGMVGEVIYADPEHCKRIVEETGIDALAAALGSVHGPYQGEPNLGFKEMKEISELINIPLVLHGGTGIPTDQIKKAIHYGHAKINVNTELAQAWTEKVRETLTADSDIYEVREFVLPAYEAVKKAAKKKIIEFKTI